MAYQAKRQKKVIEDFELVDENGEVAHALRVELDAGSMAEKISRKYVELLRAQEETANVNAGISDLEKLRNAYVRLGVAVTDIIESVFGEKDARVIFDFYSGNYVDMSREVLPFIATIIVPKVRALAMQNKKEILSKYNRKARRTIKKGLM